MIQTIISLLLSGYISNEYGRVGIVVAKDGGISHAYTHGSAYIAGIRKGDIVISADDVKGTSQITGCAGTYVMLKVKQKESGETHLFYIVRIPEREVYD